MWKTIEWKENNTVELIDQTKLPREEVYVTCKDHLDMAHAIKVMQVRGAPAIGVSGAMGVALGALTIKSKDKKEFTEELLKICDFLEATRPTAVNLAWGIGKMKAVLEEKQEKTVAEIQEHLKEKAISICREDVNINKSIGKHGAALIPDNANILTHCNAGALATAGYGTALGVVRGAVEEGKKVLVYADETRPFLQGARLTAWELMKDSIDVTVITDNMAGYLMSQKMIDLIVVGADRISANGDVANKIGTYSLAVLAEKHKIPFYVAAPISTVDFELDNGSLIPIEIREDSEVTGFFGTRVTPEGVKVYNPAFDITPSSLVSAIITENGVAEKPFTESLKKLRDA